METSPNTTENINTNPFDSTIENVPQENAYYLDDLKSYLSLLNTKVLEYELSKDLNEIFLYFSGMFDEEKNRYDLIKFFFSGIPKYKKKQSLFSYVIRRLGFDLIYGFYLPVKMTMFRLKSIRYVLNTDKPKEKIETILYEGKSLQDENGYVYFDNPIFYTKSDENLVIEYKIDESINRYDETMINRVIYPIFVLGMIDGKYRNIKIGNVPILEKQGIFYERDKTNELNLCHFVKEN